MINEVNKRVSKEWAERLEKIKADRIASGLDRLKIGQFASDVRLTRAIIKDDICKEHWIEIEKRLIKLPRGDKR